MKEIDAIERHLFLEGIFLRYGYDFRQYAEASFTRRLMDIMEKQRKETLLELLQHILSSPAVFKQILPRLTIGTTEFFRDPTFFRSLKEKVFPVLKTYPSLNVWIAGSSSGEEVVSLCILLQEAGLLKRTTLFATDINPDALERARDAIYPVASLQTFAKNYVQSGGEGTPTDYYMAEYGLARFHKELLANVVFNEHNLVTDEVFCEAHLILCRNVLIYFSRELQDRVFGLFARSTGERGFLGIGSKESLRFSPQHILFNSVDPSQNIYQLKPSFVGRTI